MVDRTFIRHISCPFTSAAAAGAAAAFADIAAAGGAHLGAAGEAQRAVDRRTRDRLEQLGGGVGAGRGLLRRGLGPGLLLLLDDLIGRLDVDAALVDREVLDWLVGCLLYTSDAATTPYV